MEKYPENFRRNNKVTSFQIQRIMCISEVIQIIGGNNGSLKKTKGLFLGRRY